MRADDVVALARSGFEFLSAQDLDPPVADRDQPVALERPQNNGDGGTPHAEHHGEEFLLECEVLSSTWSRVWSSHRQARWVTLCSALHALHC